MKFSARLKPTFVACLLLAFVVAASAQVDKKPYTEWSEKDAMKVLNSSAWAQTQTVTDTAQAFQSPGQLSNPNSSSSRSNDVVNVNFRVRLFSSKPVRQAFSRVIELRQQEKLSDQALAQLKSLVDMEFPEYIVVTLDVDSASATKKLNEANAALRKASPAEFKNNTYLSVKGKERLYLIDYHPPGKDGFGAKFFFPRKVGGADYITPESGEIFFRSEIGSVVDISVRYKVKDMTYNGKLEY